MAEPRRKTPAPNLDDAMAPDRAPTAEVKARPARSKAARKPAAPRPVLVASETDAAPAKRRSSARSKHAAAVMDMALADDPAVVQADPPQGAAAQEVLRIRNGMARIRDLLDRNSLPSDATQMLLDGLSRPLAPPHRLLAGSTAAVINLMPSAMRDAARPTMVFPGQIQNAVPPEPPIAPSMALVVRTEPSAPVPSRVGRLVSAWGDWLTWKLSPPRIPQDPEGRRKDKPRQPSTEASLPAPVVAPAESPIPKMPAAPSAIAPQPVPEPICFDQVVAKAVARIMSDADLHTHLQEMIREELEGDLGARYSANLGALIRRQVADMLDDRLTHL